jgi:hypothetical protein
VNVSVADVIHRLGRIVALAPLSTVQVQQSSINIAARGFVGAVDTSDVDVLGSDIRTRLRT